MRQSDVNRYFTMSEAEIATPFPLPKLPAYELPRARSSEFDQTSSLPEDLSSRSATASRADTSGNSGSEPTSVVYRHERAHFSPSARAGTTATPFTSPSVNAPSGASASLNEMPLVMQISAKSRPSSESVRLLSET